MVRTASNMHAWSNMILCIWKQVKLNEKWWNIRNYANQVNVMHELVKTEMVLWRNECERTPLSNENLPRRPTSLAWQDAIDDQKSFYIKADLESDFLAIKGYWSSGMILPSGGRGSCGPTTDQTCSIHPPWSITIGSWQRESWIPPSNLFFVPANY